MEIQETNEPNILIVDDEWVNVAILRNFFHKEGFRTLEANSGTEGRLLAERHLPDLILLDIMMPGESGFEMCSRLKGHPKTVDIPVIFISALEDVDSKVKGLTIGGVDYITKPFKRLEVLARVRLHIRLRQAYRAIINEQAARLRQIQEAQQAIWVLPDRYPEANFAVWHRPSQEAGGDFYDVVPIGRKIFGYFVADISGHGLGASSVCSALKALLKQNSGPLFSPIETLKIMNDVMRSIFKDGQHLTACYGHLNRLRGRLTMIGAGHPPAVYLDSKGIPGLLHLRGDVLGAFDSVTLGSRDEQVCKGDRFFLYTDGLIEGPGEEKTTRAGGLEKLMDACKDTRQIPLQDAVHEVMERIFTGSQSPQDDLLLMGVEV
jgi:sigma-B regulation protein RsbU (phosphoserine phosphatase)